MVIIDTINSVDFVLGIVAVVVTPFPQISVDLNNRDVGIVCP